MIRLTTVAAVGLLGLAIGCSDAKSSDPAPSGDAGSAGVDDSAGSAGTAQAGGGSSGDAGSAGDAGDLGDGGSDGQAPLIETPWTANSARIEIECGSFFEGSMKFRADRAQLSPAQLELLGELRGARSDSACAEDQRVCRVSIVSDTGDAVSYIADEADAPCNTTDSRISYPTLASFLETVGCHYARDEATGPDGLAADARCLNGIFTPHGGTSTELALNLSEAGRTYHVELSRCSGPNQVDQVTAKLVRAGVELAVAEPVADPGPDGICLAFDVSVAEPTVAGLIVETSAAFSPAGDFFFRFH